MQPTATTAALRTRTRNGAGAARPRADQILARNLAGPMPDDRVEVADYLDMIGIFMLVVMEI